MARRALDVTVFIPEVDGGVIIPLVPGLAAKRRLGEPMAKILASHGHVPVLIGHEGACEEGVEAIKYVLGSLEDGTFAGRSLGISEQADIVPVGHSLGARKTVHARMGLGQQSRISGIVLEAPVGLGGVRPYGSTLDALRSIQPGITLHETSLS